MVPVWKEYLSFTVALNKVVAFMTIMSRPREIVLHMYVERERGRESERGSERDRER